MSERTVTAEQLAQRMARHDWWYAYSDYAEVRRRGRETYSAMLDDLKTIPLDDARSLWVKHAPKEFSTPDFLGRIDRPKPTAAQSQAAVIANVARIVLDDTGTRIDDGFMISKARQIRMTPDELIQTDSDTLGKLFASSAAWLYKTAESLDAAGAAFVQRLAVSCRKQAVERGHSVRDHQDILDGEPLCHRELSSDALLIRCAQEMTAGSGSFVPSSIRGSFAFSEIDRQRDELHRSTNSLSNRWDEASVMGMLTGWAKMLDRYVPHMEGEGKVLAKILSNSCAERAQALENTSKRDPAQR